MTPRTPAGRALLAELSESPLPGARYAYDVVSQRIEAVESDAVALERQRFYAHEAELVALEVSLAARLSIAEARR